MSLHDKRASASACSAIVRRYVLVKCIAFTTRPPRVTATTLTPAGLGNIRHLRVVARALPNDLPLLLRFFTWSTSLSAAVFESSQKLRLCFFGHFELRRCGVACTHCVNFDCRASLRPGEIHSSLKTTRCESFAVTANAHGGIPLLMEPALNDPLALLS